ncbi:MAG: hypothetical protein GX675_06360 [Erysipelotrichaceae bacterium]|nr:hypothetical protein [Erysipelotrichaceae bacterium]
MIYINVSMYQDKLIEKVSAIDSYNISFVKKDGFNLIFKSDNDEEAAALIKKTLKSTSEFKTIYFQINVK